MDIKLPELPESIVPGVVTVRSSDLKALVDAYNAIAKLATAQQNSILKLEADITSCREDITKIAKILEALYET